MVLPLISSSPSSSSRSTRMRNLKNSISTLGVNHFSSGISSKAAQNGINLVYHRSDCGYPNVRQYCCGGNGPGSACDNHLREVDAKRVADKAIFPECEYGLSFSDIIWFGNQNYSDPNFIIDTFRNKMSNTVGIDYNWSEASFGEFKFYANIRDNYQDKYICDSSGFRLNPSYDRWGRYRKII